MSRDTNPMDAPTSRRQALRLGGVTLGLGAIVAACGDDRTGDESPGRVGYAPTPEPLGDYEVTDATLLRTVSSLELTAVHIYDEALDSGALPSDAEELVEKLRDSHQEVADRFGELTVAAGGDAWECTNPWMMDRTFEPILAVIEESDDRARDYLGLAATLENLTAATNQAFTERLTETDQVMATIESAALESRQSAVVAISVGGSDAYLSPVLFGEEVVAVDGVIPQYAITSQFGSVAQMELAVGAPDENGNRQTFILQTPAENSYVYEEYGTTCVDEG